MMTDRRKPAQGISLQRKDPESLDSLIHLYISRMKLGKGLREQLVLEAWDQVSGAGQYTLSKYVRDGVLVCSLSSSVIRNRLFYQKDAILDGINRKVMENPLMSGSKAGSKAIKSLILK